MTAISGTMPVAVWASMPWLYPDLNYAFLEVGWMTQTGSALFLLAFLLFQQDLGAVRIGWRRLLYGPGRAELSRDGVRILRGETRSWLFPWTDVTELIVMQDASGTSVYREMYVNVCGEAYALCLEPGPRWTEIEHVAAWAGLHLSPRLIRDLKDGQTVAHKFDEF